MCFWCIIIMYLILIFILCTYMLSRWTMGHFNAMHLIVEEFIVFFFYRLGYLSLAFHADLPISIEHSVALDGVE